MADSMALDMPIAESPERESVWCLAPGSASVPCAPGDHAAPLPPAFAANRTSGPKRFGAAFLLSLGIHAAFFALLGLTMTRERAPATSPAIEVFLVERAASAAGSPDAAAPSEATTPDPLPVEQPAIDSNQADVARAALPAPPRVAPPKPSGLAPTPGRYAASTRVEHRRPRIDVPAIGSYATADAAVELAIGDWLKRYQRYPRSARRAGLEGIAQVRFVIDRSGALRERELVASSGHAVLDRAAIELLDRAAPYPRLPSRIAVELIELTLPVEYRLRDATRG